MSTRSNFTGSLEIPWPNWSSRVSETCLSSSLSVPRLTMKNSALSITTSLNVAPELADIFWIALCMTAKGPSVEVFCGVIPGISARTIISVVGSRGSGVSMPKTLTTTKLLSQSPAPSTSVPNHSALKRTEPTLLPSSPVSARSKVAAPCLTSPTSKVSFPSCVSCSAPTSNSWISALCSRSTTGRSAMLLLSPSHLGEL
mmetsp:Transcript_38918/g.105388  ORF Transcript_38918/g.105388 Transcript_38918/m.105388 type:complete len:200 (+) Transcript_38918:185-784(+)